MAEYVVKRTAIFCSRVIKIWRSHDKTSSMGCCGVVVVLTSEYCGRIYGVAGGGVGGGVATGGISSFSPSSPPPRFLPRSLYR